MLEKIHETFGLSGGPPGWLRRSATTFMVIGIFAAFGLINLRSPEHIAYLEATIILTPTQNVGLLKGEAFTAQLSDGKNIALKATLRMPDAKPGDLVCLQFLGDRFRSGQYYRTAPATKCSPGVTVTFFRVM